MDDEIEGANAEVISDENGNAVTAIVHLPENESETNVETSEAIALATIHAETEIAVTAINAGVEEARIEAERERVISWQEHESEMETLRASTLALSREVEELQGRLSAAEASLLSPTPQPDLETEVIVENAIVPDESLTPQSTAENETLTENGLDDAAESAEEITPLITVPARKLRRLI